MILDACALVAALRGEPAAPVVRGLLLDPDVGTRTLATTLTEVVDRVGRLSGRPASDVALSLRQLPLSVTGVDADLAVRAGVLRAHAYHRTRAPLSLADCLVLAEGVRSGAPVATSDPDMLDTLRVAGAPYVALPRADGSVHDPAAA
ncbi:PIN domain-containing protein [Aquipuribacter nitratireducens]|uniref:PIN domain-containing protein n=1 Tax=Aquipuribacter nitratireducens TaxID=650104 RepID=A0ABW0GH03_9MICO